MTKEKGVITMGFAEGLTLLFIGLKLTNVITWSWLWVLSPLWIVYGIALAILLLILICWLIGLCLSIVFNIGKG